MNPSAENSESRPPSAVPKIKMQNVFRSDVLSSTPQSISESRDPKSTFEPANRVLEDYSFRAFGRSDILRNRSAQDEQNLNAIQRYSKHYFSSSNPIPSFSCALVHAPEGRLKNSLNRMY